LLAKLEGEAVSRRNQKEEPLTLARMKGGLPPSVSRGIVAAGAGAGEASRTRAARRRIPIPLAEGRFFVAALLRMTGLVMLLRMTALAISWPSFGAGLT
jgi:hypothetical protein